MDSRFAVRTAGATQGAVMRPDGALVRNAVATELAPSQAVTAAAAAQGVGDMGRPPQGDPSHSGEVILDPHSREIIYRAADVSSRRVVRQMTEVAARRLKAYSRPRKDNGEHPDEHADIKV
jgi:hypothetical protein